MALVSWSVYGMPKIQRKHHICQRHPPCLVRLVLGPMSRAARRKSETHWHCIILSHVNLPNITSGLTSKPEQFKDFVHKQGSLQNKRGAKISGV